MKIIESGLQYWDKLSSSITPSRRQILSIDLGTEKISAVLLEKTPTGPKLLQECIGFRDSQTSEDWWRIQLKEWIEQKQWSQKEIFFTSSRITSVIRLFQIPDEASSELKSAVHWQMKDQLPFALEDAVVEYRVMGHPVSSEGAKRMELLVAAAPQAEIKKLVDQIEGLGLKVRKVGLIPTVLENGIRQTPYVKQTIAILEMGETTTSFVIIGKGKVWFHRQLQVAGKTITEALTGSLISDSGRTDLNDQQAETLKRRYGIPSRRTEAVDPEYFIPLEKLGVMMRPALEKLTNEIRRTLDYYHLQFNHPDQKVERLLLSGGGAQLKGLAGFLQESLGMPVVPLDISSYLNRALPPEHSARVNVAISLALEQCNGFNLLPSSYRLRRLNIVQAAFLRILVITTGALLIVIYLYSVWQLKQVQLQTSSYQSALKNMRLILDLRQEVNQRKKLISEIQQQRLIGPTLMAELSKTAPANLVLDEFDFKKDEKILLLKGVIDASGEESQGILSDFIQQLSQCQFVNKVRLVTTQQHQERDQRGAGFEILCDLSK